jgi:ferrous iron transport protein B
MNPVESQQESILASIGALIAPLFTPLGFGDWRISTSLITGFIAKESVISTLGYSDFGVGRSRQMRLHSSLRRAPDSAFSSSRLLYTPCVAAVSAICRELHSKLKGIGCRRIPMRHGMDFCIYRLPDSRSDLSGDEVMSYIRHYPDPAALRMVRSCGR